MKMIEKIMQDYKIAMKERQENRKIILNYLIAQIKNKKIEVQRELTDDEVLSLIRKEVKSLGEAILFLQKAGKLEDLRVEEEKKRVLESYLPQLLDKESTKNLIQKVISDLRLTDIQKQRGQLMKELMGKYRGDLDPSVINEVLLEMK
jgi:gatB/yqeY family protein